jgi:antitoxin component YwqK of YwqJK toxin-antitoxin module
MNIKILLASLTITTICLTSCKDTGHNFDPDTWYKETKQAILEQSDKPVDSTQTEKYDDGKPHKVKYFSRGTLTVEKWYRETGKQSAETRYSNDGLFELRREICSNSQTAFEGIFFKRNAYGLSTWWGCGEHKQKEGIRYKDQKVGQWKKWDSNGKETVYDYGSRELIDSLQAIKISH